MNSAATCTRVSVRGPTITRLMMYEEGVKGSHLRYSRHHSHHLRHHSRRFQSPHRHRFATELIQPHLPACVAYLRTPQYRQDSRSQLSETRRLGGEGRQASAPHFDPSEAVVAIQKLSPPVWASVLWEAPSEAAVRGPPPLGSYPQGWESRQQRGFAPAGNAAQEF